MNIKLSGNTTGVEGTNVTLTCNFFDSVPSVDSVAFLDNGELKMATLVIITFCKAS